MQKVARDPTVSATSLNGMSITEAEMRVRVQDPVAFEVLYEYYKKPLGGRLMYLVGNKETAYDLYQDTFERVWKKLPEQSTIVNFKAWLYAIATNLAIDYLRHTKRITFRSLSEDGSNEPEDQALVSFLRVEGHEEHVCEITCIRQALEKMSPQYKVCVLLQEMWGYSQREIAELLKITEKSVSANVSRGRRQLRNAYRDMMSDLNTKKGGQK